MSCARVDRAWSPRACRRPGTLPGPHAAPAARGSCRSCRGQRRAARRAHRALRARVALSREILSVGGDAGVSRSAGWPRSESHKPDVSRAVQWAALRGHLGVAPALRAAAASPCPDWGFGSPARCWPWTAARGRMSASGNCGGATRFGSVALSGAGTCERASSTATPTDCHAWPGLRARSALRAAYRAARGARHR